jgi:hypothetical protein
MDNITTQNPKIESRKQRVEQLQSDCEIMKLVKDNIRNDRTLTPVYDLLTTRIHNNMLDRMLILKEIEIISQQP